MAKIKISKSSFNSKLESVKESLNDSQRILWLVSLFYLVNYYVFADTCINIQNQIKY